MIEIDKLPKIKGIYRQNAKLTNWFNVGGNAEILYRPQDIDDLQFFLQNINRAIKVQILGFASNVIICDEGVEGVVIKMGGKFSKIEKIEINNQIFIKAGSSASCVNVANFAKNFGLSGLEFLIGIPGSIGGAIAMNAGCYGGDISQILYNATAIDYKGEKHHIENNQFKFSYRYNSLAEKFIFVEAIFKTQKSSTKEVSKKILDLQQQRELSQPIKSKTGGSTFKNPQNKKAWELIDAIGFRGKKIGGGSKFRAHDAPAIRFFA